MTATYRGKRAIMTSLYGGAKIPRPAPHRVIKMCSELWPLTVEEWKSNVEGPVPPELQYILNQWDKAYMLDSFGPRRHRPNKLDLLRG